MAAGMVNKTYLENIQRQDDDNNNSSTKKQNKKKQKQKTGRQTDKLIQTQTDRIVGKK